MLRPISIATLAFAAIATSPIAQAQPRPPGGGAVAVAPGGGYGGRWAGGPYRPWYGPGYGYGRWGWGWGGWGYPAVGFGYGFGYGAGWAAASYPWYWGAPTVAYAAPAFYPYAYTTLPSFQLDTDVSYIQQAPPRAAEVPAAPPAAAPQTGAQAGYWYYCTEPAGYHPYVSQCSRPWIAVNPKSVAPASPSP